MDQTIISENIQTLILSRNQLVYMSNNASPKSVAHLKYQTLMYAQQNIRFEVIDGTSTNTYRRTVTPLLEVVPNAQTQHT